MMKPAEVFVFFDMSKMSLCLDGTNLPIQNTFFTFYICMGCCCQFFPLFINLHDFILVSIFFRIIFIKTFRFVFTATTVCAAIHFKSLRITILFLCFCLDMSQFSAIVTNIIMLILKIWYVMLF